jgi:hypothetical protein
MEIFFRRFKELNKIIKLTPWASQEETGLVSKNGK